MEIKLWIGDLAAYNNGTLKGEWVGFESADQIRGEIERICGENEWAIMDSEAPFKISENPDLDEIEALANIYLEAPSDEVATAAIEYACGRADEAAEIVERFQGSYRNLGEWAEQDIEARGLLSGCDEIVQRYFDYDAFGHDAVLGGDVWTKEIHHDEILVFSSI